MIVRNGICHPDSSVKPLLKVVGCRPLGEARLLVTFNNGETRNVDLSVLLNRPAFLRLAVEAVFRAFSLDHGVVSWLDGDVDIAPEWLFDHGEPYRYPEITVSAPCVAESDEM